MARAIFDPTGLAPTILEPVQRRQAPSPIQRMGQFIQSPVTNLAIAGISRAIKEGEATDRQEALEAERQQRLTDIQDQRKRAAERALGIERQIGELEAPRASLSTRQLVEAPPHDRWAGVANYPDPMEHGEGARATSALQAASVLAREAASGSESAALAAESLRSMGLGDVAAEILQGVSPEKAFGTATRALERSMERAGGALAPEEMSLEEQNIQSRLRMQRAGGHDPSRQADPLGLLGSALQDVDKLPPLAGFAGLPETADNADALIELIRIADLPEGEATAAQVDGLNAAMGALEEAGARAPLSMLADEGLRAAVMNRVAAEEAGEGLSPQGEGRLRKIEQLQQQLAQERARVREAQVAEAAVPETERLPRTFADYAVQYSQAISEGDTAKATGLLRSVEDATDIIPASAMQALTGSPAAKARKALMQMGAKIGESKSKAAHNRAKLEVERARAGASALRARAAAKNAITLGSYRVARSELVRAQALLAKERATKASLEAAKLRRRAKGSRPGIKAANRVEASGVALEMMSMLSSGAADADAAAFEALRARHDSLTGRSTVGTTFITTDPSTWAPLRASVMKRERSVANDIVKTVGEAARHEQSMARINQAERKLDEMEARRIAGAVFDVGEQSSLLSTLAKLAKRAPSQAIRNEAKAALEAQVERVRQSLVATPRSDSADAARRLEEMAGQVRRDFSDVGEY